MAKVYSLLITIYLLAWQTLNSKIFHFWQDKAIQEKYKKKKESRLC